MAASDPITAISNLATGVIDKMWPNAGEAEKAKLAAAVTLVQSQIEVNKQEAAHDSVFVAGWRPAVGWTCVAALAYTFVIYPLLLWVSTVFAPHMTPPPLTVDQMIYELLFGMLGIGALRTFEKVRGVRSSRFNRRRSKAVPQDAIPGA
jgi:hypothetical protein